jgi:DNA (cytosine-5)-methyltransferase 1
VIPSRSEDSALLKSVELCTGAGGQALGLEEAGFRHDALVEIDPHACATLRSNRPRWNVLEMDVRVFNGKPHRGVDLLAAGVPCPPFSVAGKQLGPGDERDLFPEILRLTREIRPRAVFVENVPGLLESRFAAYRLEIESELRDLGFVSRWAKLNAKDFGVSQLRPRTMLVALPPSIVARFHWPQQGLIPPLTVGQALASEMASAGWKGAHTWAAKANGIAPTLVGGSKKHGGPDLGPTRARQAWAALGVDGRTLAEAPPPPGFKGMPRLTVRMAAIIQGFPLEWEFLGKKTQAYRQVGNAFPPPMAKAVGRSLAAALRSSRKPRGREKAA